MARDFHQRRVPSDESRAKPALIRVSYRLGLSGFGIAIGIGLLLGPVAMLLVLLAPASEGLSGAGQFAGAVALLTRFLIEVTSNTATATMLLPIVVSIAAGAGIHPLGPMVAAALAA